MCQFDDQQIKGVCDQRHQILWPANVTRVPNALSVSFNQEAERVEADLGMLSGKLSPRGIQMRSSIGAEAHLSAAR